MNMVVYAIEMNSIIASIPNNIIIEKLREERIFSIIQYPSRLANNACKVHPRKVTEKKNNNNDI